MLRELAVVGALRTMEEIDDTRGTVAVRAVGATW